MWVMWLSVTLKQLLFSEGSHLHDHLMFLGCFGNYKYIHRIICYLHTLHLIVGQIIAQNLSCCSLGMENDSCLLSPFFFSMMNHLILPQNHLCWLTNTTSRMVMTHQITLGGLWQTRPADKMVGLSLPHPDSWLHASHCDCSEGVCTVCVQFRFVFYPHWVLLSTCPLHAVH